jgi:hypothetical protein
LEHDGPIEWPSEVSEVLNPPQEPTGAFPPTPNVEELIEIPGVDMTMNVDATAGLETLTNLQEEPMQENGPGNGRF